MEIKFEKMSSRLQKVKQRWSREGKKQQRYKNNAKILRRRSKIKEEFVKFGIVKIIRVCKAKVRPGGAKGSHLEADFGPKLTPRGGQEGEVRAKMAASWGQERAKRAKRRLEKRSWNEKLDFETCISWI